MFFSDSARCERASVCSCGEVNKDVSHDVNDDVSIIIPAKDRFWALPKTIESCRSKTLNIQIIVIDDASTDGTAAWLQKQRDITTIQGEGWGKPSGVNRAVAIADGTWLRFLDSDDWLNPGANEKQFAIGEREGADVVVAGYDEYSDETFVRSHPEIALDDFIARQLGEASMGHYSGFLFRRDFVKGIPHRTHFPAGDFASRDDRCFVLEVAIRHPRIAVCDTPALCHRHHKQPRLQFRNGLRGVGTNIQQLYIYRQILALLQNRGELTDRRKRAAINVLWPLAHRIAISHLDEACRVADWIHELDPDFRAPEKGVLGSLYRQLGFRLTERILSARRRMLSPLRSSTGG